MHPFGVHIWAPEGCPLEPVTSRRRVDVRPRKENKSRPIMGAPLGHPYAHPFGVCINGLGALPSPYGPTLRGAHNGPSGLQKINKIKICVWGTCGNLGHFTSWARCESAAMSGDVCLPSPPTPSPTRRSWPKLSSQSFAGD